MAEIAGPTAARLKFYTTEQLGRSQETTPEGFLICRDVPIARLGTMLYGPAEVPIDPGRDGLVRIERAEDELFRPQTIASFEGKSVTDDHPDEDVSPANWRELSRGTVQNVRRGLNPLDDLLLADLLIMDAATIKAVRAGKKEISCGYDADYEQIEPGRGAQRNIIGNHVAIVDQGRCGSRCSIGDKRMATKPKRTWKDRLLTAFKAKDEAAFEEALEGVPEEATDADGNTHHHITVNVNGAPTATEGAETKDEPEPTNDPLKPITEAIAKIGERLDALERRGTEPTADDGEDAPESSTTTDEEAEGDGDDVQRTTDSAGIRNEFQDTVARAEILAPGVKLPTFDAKATPKQTRDGMCALRRKALTTAFANDAMRKHIELFVGATPDFTKMTCDGARQVFIGASELAKAANNRAAAPAPVTTKDGDMRSTLKGMNKRNADFWSNNRR